MSNLEEICLFHLEITWHQVVKFLRETFKETFSLFIAEAIAFAINNELTTAHLCTSIFVLSALSPEKFPTAIENIKSCFSENSEQKIFFFRDYAVNDHAMLRFKKGKCISDRFYVRQDGTRAYFFNLEELETLITSAGGKVISLEYILRKTVNKAEGIEVPRVFVQGVFQF